MANTIISTASAEVSGPRGNLLPQMQSPISEEDESTETASEGAEPVTPVTDSIPHSFHHHDSTLDHAAALPKPIHEISKPQHDVPPPPLYTPPPPPTSSDGTQKKQMQSEDVNKERREATAFGLKPILPISPLSPANDPQTGSSSNSAPTTENPASHTTSSSNPQPPPAQSRTQEDHVNVWNTNDTPKKELPSLYDVPPGWRKPSAERGRSPSRRDKVDSKFDNTSSEQSLRKPSPGKPSQGITKSPTTPINSEPKRNIVNRANTFFSKLKRTPSNRTDDAMLGPVQPMSQFDASKPISARNRKPSIPISQSAHVTPSTSTSHTPPSPGSVASTISEDAQDDRGLKKITTTGGHNNSLLQNGLSPIARPRTGITWQTPAYGSSQRRPPSPETMRKRSASTDQIPKVNIRKPNEPVDEAEPMPAQLFPTFSKHANEGAGLKARRLSTSLPDEFHVDYCELNKEFKASKLFAKRGKTIGKGATAEVTIMARKDYRDVLVAVKEFRGKEKDEDESDYVKKVKSEYTIAKSLHHPNIVETIRLCMHSGRWNHVMEYCDVGDLYALVERGFFKNGYYKYEDKMCLWKQVLRGVDYLHSHGIAHRDIKLENLLMTHDGFIKITDFGVSEVFCGEHPGLRAAGGECGKNMGAVRKCAPGICGSLPYIAPEVLAKKDEYDPRPLDVWSCAIVYITMHFGGPPWHAAKTEQANYQRFIEGWDKWRIEHPDGEITNDQGGWPKCGPLFAVIDPPPLRRLLLKMLRPEPEKRVSISEALNKTFVKSIACCTPDGSQENNSCCGAIDATKGGVSKSVKASVLPKHNHVPPKDHKMPKALQHRFDMGDGWN